MPDECENFRSLISYSDSMTEAELDMMFAIKEVIDSPPPLPPKMTETRTIPMVKRHLNKRVIK